MSEESGRGEVEVRRSYDESHNVLLASGYFEPLFAVYLEHARRWGVEPEPLALTMMRQALAASALHLSTRPRDEINGWTLNFQEPPLNLFITGDAGASTVTGRVFTEGVKIADESRLFVQSHRPGHDPVQTTIDFEGLDILEIFESYYERSEQNPARFFEYDDGCFVFVLGLPHVQREWLSSLDRGAALGHVKSGHRVLDTRPFRFSCGCNAEKMKEVIKLVYEDDPDGLLEKDEEIEIQCPRCGHHWELRKGDLWEEDDGDRE